MKTILIDIEGTTTPISFVKQTLFPYILLHLSDYISANPAKQLNKAAILKAMDNDEKVPWLKDLQGDMWRNGYETGVLKGVVYPDVVEFLKKWTGAGNTVYIYSSGSVQAQKLLFKYSGTHFSNSMIDHGDLTPLIAGNFDTLNAGPKQATESYLKILDLIKKSGDEVLFLSDNIWENFAARKAGMKTVNVKREGNAEIVDFDGVQQISMFGEISDLIQ